ncbi:TRAP transporter large permease [Halomonas marinisediminis]|uniref:TRAP transporter large permease protein n=1 Tax=Halomonas marinisediminis TaxID=2546095 RepID=A0ABY2D466_9GAMM|nr:TRAP transporter large permease [Halomonas marinisediminis]TDB01188.1 TRAP transporter large permease [Halomonas marinisediminis]
MAFFSVFLLIFLMVIGVPVAWSFAVVLGYLVIVFDVNTTTLLLQGFRSLDHIILLALPLFVLAGYLMKSGGIASRLINFIELLVRGRRGGMGASMVLASGVFGAISGTATAAVASIGTIMVEPLANRGYPRGYSSALLGMSSLLGILIPPSITLILFGVITRQSITALFAATIGPGLLLLLGLILFNRFCAGRWFEEKTSAIKQSEHQPFKPAWKITFSALPALSMPVIILGGIYGGLFTPTEAAGVAVVVAIIIGFFIYRDMTLGRLKESLKASAETTGTIILILLFSFMIGRILVAERVPQELTEIMTTLVSNPILILLLINVFLIFAGAIMDDLSVTVVIAPLFMPLIQSIGVDPIHFGAIVACSVVIGANSPPVAPILFMACRIGKVSIHKAIYPALCLIAFVGIPVMVVTTFWPSLSLAIPRLLGAI